MHFQVDFIDQIVSLIHVLFFVEKKMIAFLKFLKLTVLLALSSKDEVHNCILKVESGEHWNFNWIANT